MILLGAGASVEAGIPASATMVGEIEKLLKEHSAWKGFLDLYYHVKSSIHCAAGQKGKFGDSVPYNIETLVNSLYELERNEEHPLYPFIASWNSRLVSLAGNGFEKVKKFRQLIVGELKKWMCPEDASKRVYYRGFARLQNDLNYPLRIFSLNYDRCVEQLDQDGFRVEAGFGGHGTNHIWDWERFDYSDSGPNPPPQILLYKLHGSIDWKRDEAKSLYRVEQIQTVEADQMEIIFGRDFKLEAADPYLFYAYAFRDCCLHAKLIVTVGYSFSDDHINKMLAQALRNDEERKLLVVARCTKNDIANKKKEVASRLSTKPDRIVPLIGSAKSFLEQPNIKQIITGHIPNASDTPF
jgi:hypothetical protein